MVTFWRVMNWLSTKDKSEDRRLINDLLWYGLVNDMPTVFKDMVFMNSKDIAL